MWSKGEDVPAALERGHAPGREACAQMSPWLQAQCRRLEAQHYSLSLTAEQLSHSMAVSLRNRAGSGGLS